MAWEVKAPKAVRAVLYAAITMAVIVVFFWGGYELCAFVVVTFGWGKFCLGLFGFIVFIVLTAIYMDEMS